MSDNDSRYVDYKDTEDGHEDNVVEERIIQEENPEIGVSVGISYPILLIILAFILFAFVYNVVLSLTGEPIVAIVCAVAAVLAKKIYIYSIYYYGRVQAQDPNYHNTDENWTEGNLWCFDNTINIVCMKKMAPANNKLI